MAKEVAELKEEAQNLKPINLRSIFFSFLIFIPMKLSVYVFPPQDYWINTVA